MCEVYLHERNEQEESISSSPDLLIEEPGQKGENPVLGGTAGKDREKGNFTIFLHPGFQVEPDSALAKGGIHT